MKNKLTILILVVLILIAIIWMMKPNDSLSSTGKFSESIEKTTMANEVDSHLSSTAVVVDATSSEQPDTQSMGENQLIDTKSDLSIQPIDPETDPGNQIVERN